MIFLWEAEFFGKETVILSSIGQPIAVLWNTLAETAPLWLYREIWLLREPWIILQLSVCNRDCKNAFDVRILVSGKAGTSTDLRSLCALRNSQFPAINNVHWQRQWASSKAFCQLVTDLCPNEVQHPSKHFYSSPTRSVFWPKPKTPANTTVRYMPCLKPEDVPWANFGNFIMQSHFAESLLPKIFLTKWFQKKEDWK